MDLMDLVDSIARREEQEHYIRLFSEEYGATYQRALEVSGLKSAYIKRRVYNEEHEWVPNTRALHVIGKEYQKDIEIWEHALLNIQKKERKNAYRYGKLVYGVELGEFRINMSLEDYEDLIRNANSTKTLEEVRFDEIQSRKVIREMSIKEHVGYYTLRQINDMIYLEEACDTPEDIEKYIHNAWIDLGVAYQSDKWSLEVISFIVRVAKVNTSLDSLCKAILASTESDALRSDAIDFLVARTAIDQGSSAYKQSILILTRYTDISNGKMHIKRQFLREEECENYRIRVAYEQNLQKKGTKLPKHANIIGYHEFILAISLHNEEYIRYLWKQAGNDGRRLMLKTGQDEVLVYYKDGIMEPNKKLRFLELLNEGIAIIANWFKVQGFEPFFLKQGYDYHMYKDLHLSMAMTSNECKQSILQYKKERATSPIQEILYPNSPYERYKEERFGECEIVCEEKTKLSILSKSDELLYTFAEQYFLPELLRQLEEFPRSLNLFLNMTLLNSDITYYQNKRTKCSFAVVPMIGKNSLEEVEITIPVPVIFKVNGKQQRMITNFTSFFKGENRVTNFKKISLLQYKASAKWLTQYKLL